MKRIGTGAALLSLTLASLTALCALTALPARAQYTATLTGADNSLTQLLSGREMPYTLRLRDLDNTWRALRITTLTKLNSASDNGLADLMKIGMAANSGDKKGDKEKEDDPAAAALGMSLLSGMFGGGGNQEPVYYTRGQTVTLGGETFLVTYRHNKPEGNLTQMAMQAGMSGQEPDFNQMAANQKLTPESPLSLSLINVRIVAALSGVRAFDLQQEIAESAQGNGLLEMMAREMAKEKPSAPRPASATAPSAKAAPPKTTPRKPAKPARPQ